MYINANIRALRRKYNWTQRELADKMDKAYITIGDYERGKAVPPLVTILQLCEIFQVDLHTIVYQDIEKDGLLSAAAESPLSNEVEQLRDQLRTQHQLTELQQQRLRTLEREIREQAPGLAERLGLGD